MDDEVLARRAVDRMCGPGSVQPRPGSRRQARRVGAGRWCAGRRRCRETTRWSFAARIASSSSWRSSLRGSRSPTRGSRARTSSPSRLAVRGNRPSSSPSRQTTRCGTERIGTIEHMVRPAGAEVGPGRTPAQPVGEQGADVGQRQHDRRRAFAGVLERPERARAGPGPAARCRSSVTSVSRAIAARRGCRASGRAGARR